MNHTTKSKSDAFAFFTGLLVFGIFYFLYGVFDTNQKAHDMRLWFSLFMGVIGYLAAYFG